MNIHLKDLVVSGVISHKPWSVAPGSLILTVVIAGPAGLGSNYPEGAPPEASHPWADLTWTVDCPALGFVLGDSPTVLGLC